MRVISGIARGLKLNAPEGLDTRPTLDRVKEALFSMLFDRIADACVLDLFAGSGGLGIEALSRYASECVFVDSDKRAIDAVRSNLSRTSFADRAEIVMTESVSYLLKTDKHFDIIFLDPPYEAGLYEKVFGVIKDRYLLSENGVIVAECDAGTALSPTGFEIIKEKTYGKVKLYEFEGAGLA